ncbi:MAG: PepSY-associated TM helix domain-containing protein [Bryobacteraceae bacterium]
MTASEPNTVMDARPTGSGSLWERWMRRPQSVWIRKAMFQLHLWIGIAVGIYIVVVCVSGSLLVFRNDIYDLFDGWTKAGPTPNQQSIMKTGYVAVRWMTELHGKLLLKYDGMWYNAVGGFVTSFLCVTGLVIWWPGREKWKRALGFRMDVGWKRLNFDMHSSIGFWTFLILFVWGMTGGYFVFPEPFRAVVNTFAPINPPAQPRPQQPQASSSTSPSSAAAANGAVTAAPPNGPVVLRRQRRPLTTGGKILRGFSSAHYGNFGGWPVKVLYMILGFAPVLLFGTALVMWWNRVLAPVSKRWKRGMGTAPQTAGLTSGELGD